MNVVAHNLFAMNTQRQLGINSKNKSKATERLSSGFKINRAADNAAGVSISEKMRKQIRGLSQGMENAQQGVSLCQVADGALIEVNEMLHRITELSVKSANGTESDVDRDAIQKEISQILKEIDKIGNTTTFNEMPVFTGSDEVIRNADGSPVIEGEIPVGDLSLADISLGFTPFSPSDNADHLSLQAIVTNPDSGVYGKDYKLIYGSGSTSKSSMQISYTPSSGPSAGIAVSKTVSFRDLAVSNFRQDLDNNTWSRDFTYQNADGVDMTITQVVRADMSGTNEKMYDISYEVTNNSQDIQVDMKFMFHADTAYNNNDRCEGYFTNGGKIEQNCIYSQSPDSEFTSGATSPNVITTGVPDSFSIVDQDNALAFSEKISFAGGNKPDSLSIGYYYSIDDWSYYDQVKNNTNAELGQTTEDMDLGFSMMWSDSLGAGNAVGGASNTVSYKFSYGIVATASDTNLDNVQINQGSTATATHKPQKGVWIHSGSEKDDGIMVEIDEMNCEYLGIDDLDVTSTDGALNALKAVKEALYMVSSNRSKIGAQQNRLEHTIANESCNVENTTSAESIIRDADMAKEMIRFTNAKILDQAGVSMLSMANQSNQGVLSLLQ